MGEAYWADETCSLYLGDCREILPALGVTADLIVADPPYSCTPLAWDRWPDGWLEVAASVTRSMWCFLPLRQFAEPPYRGIEFRAAGWKLSQDSVWEKGNGGGVAADRFRRVHENMTHWYRGLWRDIYHVTPRVAATPEQMARNGTAPKIRASAAHLGKYGRQSWREDGTRLIRSVVKAKSRRGLAIHETEKPPDLLSPLIEYACPPGGLLIDPFAGSCSSLMTARMTGRHAIGIESREAQAEQAIRRLSRMDLFGEAS